MLVQRHCTPVVKGSAALDKGSIDRLRAQLDHDWVTSDDQRTIRRSVSFPDYPTTLAFANAVAWVALREDHHPQLTLDYRTCTILYTTHAAAGLTENDFICAAHIDHLLHTTTGK